MNVPEGKTATHVDGWVNFLTGLGLAQRDKKKNTIFSADGALDSTTLAELYRTDGFSKKIVDLPVYEMLREGFEVTGDTDNEIINYLDDRQLNKALWNFLTADGLFGGAILILGLNDGGKLEEELDLKSLQSIDWFRVYNRNSVNKTNSKVTDPENPRFGLTYLYEINPKSGSPYKVHWSRVIELSGRPIPSESLSAQNQGWGDSVLLAAYEACRSLGSIYSYTESIIDDFVTTIISMKGLADAIAMGRENDLYTRLQVMDMGKSLMSTLLLDEEESFEKKTSTVTGLSELIDRFVDRLSSQTGIPVRVLMGKQSGGLNNEGQGETRDWYDKIAARQREQLQPILERIIELAMICSQGPTQGKEIENWAIEFKPLWQMSEKEEAEVRKIQAETDQVYIDSGVLAPEEVTLSRFGGDSYSTETTLILEPDQIRANLKGNPEPTADED